MSADKLTETNYKVLYYKLQKEILFWYSKGEYVINVQTILRQFHSQASINSIVILISVSSNSSKYFVSSNIGTGQIVLSLVSLFWHQNFIISVFHIASYKIASRQNNHQNPNFATSLCISDTKFFSYWFDSHEIPEYKNNHQNLNSVTKFSRKFKLNDIDDAQN